MAIGSMKPILGGRGKPDQLILWAEIVLAVLLVILLFKIAFLFVKLGDSQVIPPTSGNVPTQTANNGVDTSILSTFDPFYREQTGPAVVVAVDAPETTLDLRVFGMRADLEGDSSSAIIETPDNEQNTYAVGDEIVPGVILESVDIDFVILNRNGTRERLSRQGKTEDDKASGATIVPTTLSFEAAQMIKDIRFYPKREGKKVIGLRVLPQRGSDAVLEKYGFERGDVITSINGEDLTQAQLNLPKLFKNLKLARYANVQLLRDDVPMTIEVNLQ